MVDRWMPQTTTFHCFLLVLTGGSGLNSSNAALRRFVLFQLLQYPMMLMHNCKWRRSLPPLADLGLSIPNKCLNSASNCSFLYEIWFSGRFSNLSKAHSKESFHFLFSLFYTPVSAFLLSVLLHPKA